MSQLVTRPRIMKQTRVTNSLCLWFCSWVRESRLSGLLQARGVVLDHGGPGVLCRCAQHDWGLVSGHLQED